MILATNMLQRVPGFTRSRNYVTYLSSCCSAIASLIHKPACIDSNPPAEIIPPQTSSDDPFSVFKDLSFFDDSKNKLRSNDTSKGGNRTKPTDDGDCSLDKTPDSDSLTDILAQNPHQWSASSIPSFANANPESFPSSSWIRRSDFANTISNGSLTDNIYPTDNKNKEQHPQWLSASSTPTAQHFQPPLPQPNQLGGDNGGWPPPSQQQQQRLPNMQQTLWHGARQPQLQWSPEMGMGFWMTKDGTSSCTEPWLN